MTIYFIGAGPGDPELLTIKGKKLLAKVKLCIYAGSFISKDFVQLYVHSQTQLIDSASLGLENIIDYMCKANEKGEDVARLHSGDPSLYSAMQEQIEILKLLNIPYEITPGVPAFCAAAAVMGQELTLPNINQTLILTRAGRKSSPVPSAEDLRVLGQSRASLILHLSIKNVQEIYQKLAPLFGNTCPVVIAYRVSFQDEKILRTNLGNLIHCVEQENLQKTALIFIGQALDEKCVTERSKLYQKKLL